MIAFILIVSLITLLDISGSHLDPKIVPLVHIVDEPTFTSDGNLAVNVSGGSSEDIAKKAENYIFKGDQKDD